MKILLTGASGRLGSALCRHLLEKGHEIRAVDRVFRGDLPVPIRVADLLDRYQCYGLLEGIEALVHFANHAGYRSGDEQKIFSENVTVNMNLFQAASHLGVKKIVFASSVQVMSGRRDYTPSQKIDSLAYLPVDGETPANPGNPYALSKRVSEEMLMYFSRYQAMDTVALRLPGISDERWLASARRDRGNFDSSEVFSWLALSDLKALIEAILRAPLKGYHCYFPAARNNGLLRPVQDVIREFYPKVSLRRPLEQMDSLVDVSAIERDTGWTPQINEF